MGRPHECKPCMVATQRHHVRDERSHRAHGLPGDHLSARLRGQADCRYGTRELTARPARARVRERIGHCGDDGVHDGWHERSHDEWRTNPPDAVAPDGPKSGLLKSSGGCSRRRQAERMRAQEGARREADAPTCRRWTLSARRERAREAERRDRRVDDSRPAVRRICSARNTTPSARRAWKSLARRTATSSPPAAKRRRGWRPKSGTHTRPSPTARTGSPAAGRTTSRVRDGASRQ